MGNGLKGDERKYYLKELMRLTPLAKEEARKLFENEQELRAAMLEERAKRFRDVKLRLYGFLSDCRVRNAELIWGSTLSRKEWALLWRRFVVGYTWRMLYNSQGYSSDHCKRIHRDALVKIAQQHPDRDFRAEYEKERDCLDALLKEIGEKG